MKNAYIGSTVSNPHSFPAAVSKPRPPAPRIRGLGDIVHAALKALEWYGSRPNQQGDGEAVRLRGASRETQRRIPHQLSTGGISEAV
jgi:hypothetical protein